MDVNKPILSIIIPTRNRFDYAIYSIQNVLSIDIDDFELVIQDSSDQKVLAEYIENNISDRRLRYNYSPPPVSMVENFNIAARKARGEYVCFIGDDDGVNPDILQLVYWAYKNKIDAVTPILVASYCWPDFESRFFGKKHASKMYLRPFSGKIKYHRPKEEIRKSLQSGGQSFYGLPKVYYGIVRKEIMDQVLKKVGRYFGGTSPDLYGAMAIAFFSETICTVDYPYLVPGGAAKSNAGVSAKGKHVGILENIPHLDYKTIEGWPILIPRFYSVETVWAQSALAAIIDTGNDELIHWFNIPKLHAICILNHFNYRKLIMSKYFSAMSTMGKGAGISTALLSWALLTSTVEKAFRLLLRLINPSPSQGFKTFSNINNIFEAAQILREYLPRGGKPLENYPIKRM